MAIAMGDGIMDMGIHMAANSVEMEDAIKDLLSLSYELTAPNNGAGSEGMGAAGRTV